MLAIAIRIGVVLLVLFYLRRLWRNAMGPPRSVTPPSPRPPAQAESEEPPVPVFTGTGGEASPEERARLLKLCHGNRALVWRLLNHEIDQLPGISERDACRNAIRRIERDNG